MARNVFRQALAATNPTEFLQVCGVSVVGQKDVELL